MGEAYTVPVPQFNRSIRVESRPERLSSEGGTVALREVAERLGLLDWLAERLEDPRDPQKVTHPLRELLATELLLVAQGWGDQDDADALRHDPLLRLAVSTRRGTAPLQSLSTRERVLAAVVGCGRVPEGLASQPTLSRLHAALSTGKNRWVLDDALLVCAARRVRAMRGGHRPRYLTVDLDSLPVEVEGRQEGSAHNGHYHARVYHPLVATAAEVGDLLSVVLREGDVHTAEGGLDFLLPLLDRVEEHICQVAGVRVDAGFPNEEFLSALEKRETPYVARIKNNAALDRMAEPFLVRPPGRPPAEPRTWFHEMSYRAGSWSRERRVVLVVQERPDELFLHHFWLLTSRTPEEKPAEELLAWYRERGTAEGHMGEWMDVLDPALSSTRRPKSHYAGREPARRTGSVEPFAVNEVRLLLSALAYNLMHVLRTLLEAGTRRGWGLRKVREKVLKVAARVLVHARRVTVVIAETSAPLWEMLWSRLARLPVAGLPLPGT